MSGVKLKKKQILSVNVCQLVINFFLMKWCRSTKALQSWIGKIETLKNLKRYTYCIKWFCRIKLEAEKGFIKKGWDLKVVLSMPMLLRRLFCRYSSLRWGRFSNAPEGIFSSLLFCVNIIITAENKPWWSLQKLYSRIHCNILNRSPTCCRLT